MATTTYVPVGPYTALQPPALSLDTGFVVSVASDQTFAWPGPCVLEWTNTVVGAATITITSQSNPADKRTGDITTYAVAGSATTANCSGSFFFASPVGWADTNGLVHFTTSASTLFTRVIRVG